MLWHADNQIDDRKCHQHNFEILVAEERNEEFEQTFRLAEDTCRVRLDAALDCDVNLIYG